MGRVPRPPKKSASHDIYCSFSPLFFVNTHSGLRHISHILVRFSTFSSWVSNKQRQQQITSVLRNNRAPVFFWMNPWHFANCTYLYVPITEQSYVTAADTVANSQNPVFFLRTPRIKFFPLALPRGKTRRFATLARCFARVSYLLAEISRSFLLAHFGWILVELPSPP